MLFTFPVCIHFLVVYCLEHDMLDFGIFFMWVAGCYGFFVILGLLLISGLFPVFSCVLALKSLIINTIHFSGICAFVGYFCCGVRYTLVSVGYGGCQD